MYAHSEVRVEGLETLDYLDNLCQKERFTEQGDALTFETEVSFNFYQLPLMAKQNEGTTGVLSNTVCLALHFILVSLCSGSITYHPS